MNVTHHVLPINLTSVTNDEPIVEVPCNGCTVCCQKLHPFLTPEEITSGKYPLSLVQSNNSNDPIVALYKKPEGGCSMLANNKCLIYEDRPIACRQFDCRKNHHPSIPNMIDL